MWLIVVTTLLNAWANNREFVLEYRVDVAGIPINVFDVLLGVGLVMALWRATAIGSRKPRPPLDAPVVIFVASSLFLTGLGMLVGLSGGIDFRPLATAARNYAAMPVAVLVGYYGIRKLDDLRRFTYVVLVAGFGVSLLVIAYFSAQGQEFTRFDTVNKLRTVQYVSNYASFSVCVLLYALLRTVRLFPPWLSLALIAVCFVGQVATLSRSDWLATAAAMAVTILILPAASRMRNIRITLVSMTFLAVAMYGAVLGASALMGRNFDQVLVERLQSMVPDENRGVKAWDSRLPGAEREFQLWLASPALGQGFGIQEQEEARYRYNDGSWRHNTFTSILAEVGVLGLLPILYLLGSCFTAGRRLVHLGRHRALLLAGALGAVTPSFYLVLGLATQSFNQMRFAIPLAFCFGMIRRAMYIQEGLAAEQAPARPPPAPTEPRRFRAAARVAAEA